MANNEKKNNIKDERVEDVTMYGEVVPSLDQWITPDIQKKNAKRLENATFADGKNGKTK